MRCAWAPRAELPPSFCLDRTAAVSHPCSCAHVIFLCDCVSLLFPALHCMCQARWCASGRARWSGRRMRACARSITPTCRRNTDEPSCTSCINNKSGPTTRRTTFHSLRQCKQTNKQTIRLIAALGSSRSVALFSSDVSCCRCFCCRFLLCSARPCSCSVLTPPDSATCLRSCARRATAI